MSDKVIKRETEWLEWISNPMGGFFVTKELVTLTWKKPDGTIYQTQHVEHHQFEGWD